MFLRALAAPSREQYREVMRPFHERRGTRLRAAALGAPDAADIAPSEPHRRSTGPAVAESATEVCTTTWDGETYTDECADEGEVLAFHAELDAMQAEVDADKSELLVLCAYTCGEAEEEELSSAAGGDAVGSWQPPITDANVLDLDGPAWRCGGPSSGQAESRSPRPGYSCLDDAVAATVGAVYWASEVSAFKGLGSRIARMAFGSAQARLAIAGFGVGYLIGSAINCYAA
jgi:hypothetical protein